jgi:hypothetical protein
VNGNAYTPDPENVLLYYDESLNGLSSNNYFYAIKLVDTNGLQSVLSLATPPVSIPLTAPPPAPVVTSLLAGENEVIIRWAKSPAIPVAGYLLYRTQDKSKAADWRMMEPVGVNGNGTFTVTVNGDLPDKEFEYHDATVTARVPYYYGLIAVGLNDEGKWLKSGLSQVVTGQAYDQTPPPPTSMGPVSFRMDLYR